MGNGSAHEVRAWDDDKHRKVVLTVQPDAVVATVTCMTDGCDHRGKGRDVPLPYIAEGVVARMEPVCAGCLLPMMVVDGPYRAKVVNGRIVSRLPRE